MSGEPTGVRGVYSTSGFSLLELMVVIFIVALGSSLTIAWLGGTDSASRLRSVAQQLAAEFQLAGDIATARQQVIGWQPLEDGYRFLSWQADGRWQPWGERSGLTPQRWPLTVHPQSDLHAWHTHAQRVVQQRGEQPWLVWLPSGEVIGGRVILHGADTHVTIEVDALTVRLTDGGGR